MDHPGGPARQQQRLNGVNSHQSRRTEFTGMNCRDGFRGIGSILAPRKCCLRHWTTMCVLRAGVEGQAGKTQGGRRGRGKSSGAGSNGVTGVKSATEPADSVSSAAGHRSCHLLLSLSYLSIIVEDLPEIKYT